MNGNYIKICRSLLNWEWFGTPNTLSVFIFCLLKANWKDGRFEGQVIERGSFVTSVSNIADSVGLSIQQTRTALKHLETTGEITIKTTNKYSVITVKNYGQYQDANNQITNEQQTTNNQITNKQQTTNNNRRKKEGEESKEGKKGSNSVGRFSPPTADEVREYCDEKGYRVDPERFCDYYTSNGWMVGKNKMKDWKAAVRTWARQDKAAEPRKADVFDEWRNA